MNLFERMGRILLLLRATSPNNNPCTAIARSHTLQPRLFLTIPLFLGSYYTHSIRFLVSPALEQFHRMALEYPTQVYYRSAVLFL